MITIDDLLAPSNVSQAKALLMSRKGSAGPDGMPVAEIEDYWKANGEQISAAIREGRYRPEAVSCFEIVTGTGKRREVASINARKSGIYRAISRRVLGYDLVQGEYGVEVRRHAYQPQHRYDSWYSSVVSRQDGTYHIVQDGVITRKDYSLLFENDEERHHIPVEVTTQLNVYGNVTVTPEALATMCQNGIKLAYVDRYGDMMGTFEPESHTKSADVFLKQALLYADEERRLELARKLEVASVHNMRANLRYYAKRGVGGTDLCIAELNARIAELATATCVNDLMLIEARARRVYYATFAEILVGEQFDFTSRTRRPPRDRGNAMVSFGNVVLYNFILQCIWKTSLDPKIGIVHATNRRNHSLNLDIADLFKPILVDRVIFGLVNRHEMDAGSHFVELESGGILLSQEGKKAFLHRFQAKLDDCITRKQRRLTYRQLVADEVWALQRHIADGSAYNPYKYY